MKVTTDATFIKKVFRSHMFTFKQDLFYSDMYNKMSTFSLFSVSFQSRQKTFIKNMDKHSVTEQYGFFFVLTLFFSSVIFSIHIWNRWNFQSEKLLFFLFLRRETSQCSCVWSTCKCLWTRMLVFSSVIFKIAPNITACNYFKWYRLNIIGLIYSINC